MLCAHMKDDSDTDRDRDGDRDGQQFELLQLVEPRSVAQLVMPPRFLWRLNQRPDNAGKLIKVCAKINL